MIDIALCNILRNAERGPVRTKSAQASAVTTTSAYDLAGRETSVADTLGNIIASAYDTTGRLASVTNTVASIAGAKAVSYQYDASGNRTRITWPDSYYVSYSFDALNRMSGASENGSTTLATYAYDPLSRRSSLTYGNSASVAYTYTQGGDLVSLVHDLSGTTNDATTTFGYNLAHQLNGESFTNAAWKQASPSAVTTAYTVNGLNQYPTVGGTTYSWDAQGNLTGDGTFTYGYDAENRLLTASKTGVAATYAYDPRGRRTIKSGTGVTATSFLLSGDDEIAEYDGSNTPTRRFIPGPAIDQPIAMVTAAGTRTYFHANHQGSIVAMSDASGALAEGPYTYDAYGKVSSTTGEPYRFTGRRLDTETGLYYYRARYYNPVTGRFQQTDPVGYKDDFNPYSYVSNDPANGSDPSGKACADECPALVQAQRDLAIKHPAVAAIQAVAAIAIPAAALICSAGGCEAAAAICAGGGCEGGGVEAAGAGGEAAGSETAAQSSLGGLRSNLMNSSSLTPPGAAAAPATATAPSSITVTLSDGSAFEPVDLAKTTESIGARSEYAAQNAREAAAQAPQENSDRLEAIADALKDILQHLHH